MEADDRGPGYSGPVSAGLIADPNRPAYPGQHLRWPPWWSGTLTPWIARLLSVAILIWPAMWNGYPIVFADTGTYLSQAMHRYLGWDRPAFYSLFIYPWHLGLTTWPVILVQSCLTVLVLDLTRRAFGLSSRWLLALTVALGAATWLPWIVSELTPDVLTPLLVLLLSLLVFSPSSIRGRERLTLTALAACMIATQQSSVPLSAAVLCIAYLLRFLFGRFASRLALGHILPAIPLDTATRGFRSRAAILVPLLAPCLAVAALAAVNVVALGRVSISPYGNVFLLARTIYDGPGMTVLRRDCPGSGWRLCPWLDRFPPTSDGFLWDKTSPIMLAGGHKAVSADADAIIRAAVLAEPGRLSHAAWDNAAEQLFRFASGDGLNAWNDEAGATIERDFPLRERLRFRAARQQREMLTVPPALALAHRIVAIGGIVAALVLLPLAWRRGHVAVLFLAMSLLVQPVSAAITGALSTPHDRYQSRIVWLPACMAFLALPALFRRSRSGDEHDPPADTPADRAAPSPDREDAETAERRRAEVSFPRLRIVATARDIDKRTRPDAHGGQGTCGEPDAPDEPNARRGPEPRGGPDPRSGIVFRVPRTPRSRAGASPAT